MPSSSALRLELLLGGICQLLAQAEVTSMDQPAAFASNGSSPASNKLNNHFAFWGQCEWESDQLKEKAKPLRKKVWCYEVCDNLNSRKSSYDGGRQVEVALTNPKGLMLSSNSATLKQPLHADLKLVPRAKTSWASDILCTFEGLRGCDTYTQAFLQGLPICYSDHCWPEV